MSYIQLHQWLSKSILKVVIDGTLTMSDGNEFQWLAALREKS